MPASTPATQAESQLLLQQNESFAHTHCWIAAFVHPAVACTVQQLPTLEHVPMLHVSPAQHSVLIMQAAPAFLHAIPPPHTLFTQVFGEQHSALFTHACPVALQFEHAKLLHVSPLQQSAVTVQI